MPENAAVHPDQWQRIRLLFPELVTVPATERGPWLHRHCSDDPAVRDHLERLIDADEASSDWLEPGQSLEAIFDQPTTSLSRGTRIGQYELQELIAVGGTGTVWRAEQHEPRRVVALKTLRADLPGPEAVRRFRAEAEILGYLRHPAIARVFEAGTTSLDGRMVPYLALEYVEGSRDLIRSSNERSLDRCGRLQLFATVCDAVHHGHQRGVIHRDLKPSNILVDPDGNPKVIDFGLARVLAPEQLQLSLVQTRSGELLGTLAYMSPEHVASSQHEIDARSDIYALGCILVELLVGRAPLDLGGLSLPQIARRICEDEPSLPRELPPDLRWILARCLEKDPDRRYPAASELAADIRRYLAHEPVAAHPPSAYYRWRRIAWRHRALLLAALGVIAALAVGLVQARKEARAARLAEGLAKHEKEQAELARAAATEQLAISTSTANVLAELLALPSPYREGGSVLVRDAIAQAERDLPSIPEPTARAIIGSIVAQGLLYSDERTRAGQILEGALPVLRASLAPSDPLRLRAEVTHADYLEREERFAESLELSETLLPALEGSFGAAHPLTVTLRTISGACKHQTGDWAGAIAAFRANLELLDRSAEGAHPSGARVDLLNRIGVSLRAGGRLDESRAMLEEALAMARALGTGASQQEANLLLDLGNVSFSEGKLELALESYREASRLFDLAPPAASSRFSLEYQTTAALLQLGRLDEAAQAARACRAVLETTWSTPGLRSVKLSLLECFIASAREDHARAAAIAREAIPVAEGLAPRPLDVLGQLRSTYAESLLASGQAQEAAREAELAHATLAEALGAESRPANLALERWVRALLAVDEAVQAAELARVLVERTEPEHQHRADREELLRRALQVAAQASPRAPPAPPEGTPLD